MLRAAPRLFDVQFGEEELRAFLALLAALQPAARGAAGGASAAAADSDAARRRLWAQNVAPPAVARTLHSKACRGAIMFGDVLSRAECRELVARLARCRLPFQCAHGRPSMLPLVTLVGGSGGGCGSA